MRKVVDSNYLQSDDLREYFLKSRKNHAVLTDYAAIEAYKGNTLSSIYRSMDILSLYPEQVIVLKGTMMVCGLSGNSSGLQKRLIDHRQTVEFATYCKDLSAARGGNTSLQQKILSYGRTATKQMDRMLDDSKKLAQGIEEISRQYTDAELKAFRTSGPMDHRTLDKIIKNILELAAYMFRDHPSIQRLPNFDRLGGTFIFRAALCAHLMALRWISVGGAKDAKLEKLRNDIVDVSFAAYATYFDGLLTKDRNLLALYKQATRLLPIIFAPNPTNSGA